MSRARSSNSASLASGRSLLLSRDISASLHSRGAAPVGVGWLLVVNRDIGMKSCLG